MIDIIPAVVRDIIPAVIRDTIPAVVRYIIIIIIYFQQNMPSIFYNIPLIYTIVARFFYIGE